MGHDESTALWFTQPYQSVATRRETRQGNRNFHKHDFIELIIVLNGTGTHITKGTEHTVCAGDAFVVQPEITHAYTDTKNLSLFNILIHNQHLQSLEREFIGMPGFYALFKLEPRMRVFKQFKSQLQLSAQDFKEISNWIDALEVESEQTTYIACSKARAFLHLIVCHLCMQYEAIASVDSNKLLLVANCIHYMDVHLSDSLHLTDLAHAAGMSERSLSRNFHDSVGQSPIEYLLNMRLQRAGELLLASPTPITQIAFEVGFGDANYFTRQFRKWRGVSPRAFRKQFQQA
jgi:AraC-like DNA-binding protein/mannose-6-phosphate isomerase-like protein (cupin superfamily)